MAGDGARAAADNARNRIKTSQSCDVCPRPLTTSPPAASPKARAPSLIAEALRALAERNRVLGLPPDEEKQCSDLRQGFSQFGQARLRFS
jgi:hypothetical protein